MLWPSVRPVVLLVVLLIAFLAQPSPTLAWGCKGHQTIALIAEKHLTPEARQFIDKLLTENPVDPQLKRYCGSSTRDLLADASTWPDDVRNDRKNGPWHFIDIPRGNRSRNDPNPPGVSLIMARKLESKEVALELLSPNCVPASVKIASSVPI